MTYRLDRSNLIPWRGPITPRSRVCIRVTNPNATKRYDRDGPSDRAHAVRRSQGIRFAYRRFGKAGGVPLVFNMHFTGTMDHWDPLVTDGFAKDREVILFDNAGISSNSGEVPSSVEPI